MGTSALKSTVITNLDANPVTRNTAGEGGPGRLQATSGFVTAVASDAAGSTYRLVRLPSNCKVKSVIFESQAQGAGKVQLGLYYSDSATDGSNAATPATALDVKFFSDDIDCTSAVVPVEKVFGTSGSYTPDKRNKALWDAAGLTTDPGGFIDIVATVHTTAITTGTGMIWVNATYID
jgi:hypothetical protein